VKLFFLRAPITPDEAARRMRRSSSALAASTCRSMRGRPPGANMRAISAVGFIAVVVIRREERFLERNFHDQYSSYKATVRRWL
jgi:protein-S-isoprenylcysteine O-methyltransferase Ste14